MKQALLKMFAYITQLWSFLTQKHESGVHWSSVLHFSRVPAKHHIIKLTYFPKSALKHLQSASEVKERNISIFRRNEGLRMLVIEQ